MKKTIIASTLFALASSYSYADTLKLGHVYDVNHPWHKSAEEAARRVAEKTEGRVEIKIFPSSALGSEQELLEQVIVGGVDIVEVGSGQLGNIFKPIIITEMPYIFRDNEHLLQFFESETADKIFNDFHQQFNAHIVGSSTWGVRHVIGNKSITNPEDFNNFKLRVPEQAITMAYAKAMGSNPTPVPYSEAYLAMRQNMVDGLENPLGSIRSMKFYEVGNNLSLTGHVITAVHYVVNDNSLQSLSSQDKEAVLSVFKGMGRYTKNLVEKDDKNSLEFFKEQGVNIVEVDRDAFKEKTKKMSDDYKKNWSGYGDLYTEISNL
ncbi:DctP family TRAP transporter solute-binding subunit [Oceanisphaera pacifica]|uniref:DctP family TRAP transporter solute-binding subunit n=1 Tax=Oceanisphaera pacifica TaxID=2818389 RepID=A0ABS3NJC5_9GAMM|nr:DctP family TRAP transporter solute-binding subunit [Oceanisphaera pacifica]MBO1520706.1 DctP family TRAP transporter solute-binding subunit [Oceanisphaera pacifica]